MTRGQGKPRSEFPFVDVEIRAADPASVNTEKNFVGLDFGNRDIAVFEFTRRVVNNGFHRELVLSENDHSAGPERGQSFIPRFSASL